jgi:hypothetical protein
MLVGMPQVPGGGKGGAQPQRAEAPVCWMRALSTRRGMGAGGRRRLGCRWLCGCPSASPCRWGEGQGPEMGDP